MMEQPEWTPLDQKMYGTVEIAPEVIEVIAGIASLEIEGVNAMSGGFIGDVKEKLGRKNFRKGVNVKIGQQEVEIGVSVIIELGYPIPRVANDLQHNIKQSIETMTSLSVKCVNVYVTDVEFSNRP